MTTISIDTTPDGIDDIEFSRDEATGAVSVTITVEDVTIEINVGRLWSDAEALKMVFGTAAAASAEFLENWEDRPDEFDGYVMYDDGRYYVRLGGKDRGNVNRGYPSKEIAVIELAQAMVDDGTFPNVWYEESRGTVELDSEVRARHDEGGTGMLALDTEYLDDQDVMVNHRMQTGPMKWEKDWLHATVIHDYGDAGVLYAFSGDDTDHVITDRDDIRAPTDQEDNET